MPKSEVIKRFQAIGKAALILDIEDSHSGNLAEKYIDEKGHEFVVVTATGSQKGDLSDTDICFAGMHETTYGHYKASSETDIHAGILSKTGASASMHAHTKFAVIETLDDEDKPNKPKPLIPIDKPGFYGLGGIVPVEWYAVPSGSPEMAKLIPEHLKNFNATIVQGHGTFAKGRSLEEAFFYLALVENSGYILYFCRLLGLDVGEIKTKAKNSPESFFHGEFEIPNWDITQRCDFEDEPQTVKEFLKAGNRLFESKLSPFFTGSISLRCVDTMLYAPYASMPYGVQGPLLEVPLKESGDDTFELSFHKRIYDNSIYQTVMHAYVPEAEIVANYYFKDKEDNSPKKLIPIDAEGGFLYLAVPIYTSNTNFDTIMKGLHEYHVVIIKGGGVWAVGEQAISEVLHHPSSIRDICFYRIHGLLKKLDLTKLEPKKAQRW